MLGAGRACSAPEGHGRRWDEDSSTGGVAVPVSTGRGCRRRGVMPRQHGGAMPAPRGTLRIIRRSAPVGAETQQGLDFGGVPSDSVTRVRPGAYVLGADWDEAFSETRLRTLADAVARRCRDDSAAFCRLTAAALWRLPVYRTRSDRAHMVFPHEYTRRNSGDLVRHQEPLPRGDVVVIDGHRVTSLDRTVYDVIRTASLEASVVVFDAALRSIAWDDAARSYDSAAAEGFRGLVAARIRRGVGARGIRQARFVSQIADGRAQLPGESVTRLWLHLLGVSSPHLQYRVDFDDGGFALLDLAWPDRGRWMEFDGDVKYGDPAFMSGRSTEEVLSRQRAREARIISVTGWHCDRHGFDRMATFDQFAVYIRSIGLT